MNNSVELLSPSQLLKVMESEVNNVGLPLCTVSAFYSPTCFFSAEMAPHLNALPRMFPNLRVVAVDATEQSRFGLMFFFFLP